MAFKNKLNFCKATSLSASSSSLVHRVRENKHSGLTKDHAVSTSAVFSLLVCVLESTFF